ncbi:MAG: hypothetical protein FWH18_04460 [Marinilabiliaceae bacterium]|nr:hypothetical protein [Marinilabiliaceae bacterium]
MHHISYLWQFGRIPNGMRFYALNLFSTERHIRSGMWKTENDKYFIKRGHFDFPRGKIF